MVIETTKQECAPKKVPQPSTSLCPPEHIPVVHPQDPLKIAHHCRYLQMVGGPKQTHPTWQRSATLGCYLYVVGCREVYFEPTLLPSESGRSKTGWQVTWSIFGSEILSAWSSRMEVAFCWVGNRRNLAPFDYNCVDYTSIWARYVVLILGDWVTWSLFEKLGVLLSPNDVLFGMPGTVSLVFTSIRKSGYWHINNHHLQNLSNICWMCMYAWSSK